MDRFIFRSDLSPSARALYSARLFKLAELISSLDQRQYNHARYVSEYDTENMCNTVCCSLGWAAVRKDLFPDLPLVFRNYPDERYPYLDSLGNRIPSTVANEYFGGWRTEYDLPFYSSPFKAIFDVEAFGTAWPSLVEVSNHIKRYARESFIEEVCDAEAQ